MGEYFTEAGFLNVEDMVRAMMESEQKQLDAFVNFVNSNGDRKEALQKKDWASFANAYNGESYKDNNYDQKMMDAYDAQSAKDKVVPSDVLNAP